MDKTKEYIERAREMFADHVAEIKEDKTTGTTVIDWRNVNGSSIYSIRYILNGGHLYVSGDVGCAVFKLTWKATIKSFKDINIEYLGEKLKAIEGNKFIFDPKLATEEVIDRLGCKFDIPEDINDDNIDAYFESIDIEEGTPISTFKEIIERISNCYSICEWHEEVHELRGSALSELCDDYSDWLYSIGQTYSLRLVAYIVGLWMINEQLEEE